MVSPSRSALIGAKIPVVSQFQCNRTCPGEGRGHPTRVCCTASSGLGVRSMTVAMLVSIIQVEEDDNGELTVMAEEISGIAP